MSAIGLARLRFLVCNDRHDGTCRVIRRAFEEAEFCESKVFVCLDLPAPVAADAARWLRRHGESLNIGVNREQRNEAKLLLNDAAALERGSEEARIV